MAGVRVVTTADTGPVLHELRRVGYPRAMTDPVNPEAPHSPGTPDLDDLDTPEPEVPVEQDEDASEPPD